jgi:transposase
VTSRCGLTAEQFALVQDLLPPNGGRGGQWNDHRTTLDGIFWILHTGAHLRELPERHGYWKSVYDRFNHWSNDGMIDRMLEWLHLRLDEDGRIDVETWHIDATLVRAGRSAAGGRGEKPARRAR